MNTGTALMRELASWKLDAKLEDTTRYFFHTEEVDAIAAGNVSYVIGRKGTGKTAISEHLTKLSGPRVFSQKLTFKNFPFNDLYQHANSSFTPPNQYITFWKYVIYSCVARLVIPNEAVNFEFRQSLSKAYSDDLAQSLPRAISRWTSKRFELSVLGTGGALEREETKERQDAPWIDRVSLLEVGLQRFLDDSLYLIVFDELDEDFKSIDAGDHHTQYVALLTGLFKAAQDIRAAIPSPTFRVFPVIFLRDDIYNVLKDPDKTKWSDLARELDWTEDRIKQLLAFRLARAKDPNASGGLFSSEWADLFTSDLINYGHEGKKRTDIFAFISRATQVRPRDYIRYLKACAEATIEQGRSRISPSVVSKVDKAFSNYLKSELEDEIQGVLPEIADLFNLLSHVRKQTFRVDEFNRRYRDAVAAGNLPARDPANVLRVLFHFSVIGNQTRAVPHTVFRYLNREARFNPAEAICLHRGLFKALQIV